MFWLLRGCCGGCDWAGAAAESLNNADAVLDADTDAFDVTGIESDLFSRIGEDGVAETFSASPTGIFGRSTAVSGASVTPSPVSPENDFRIGLPKDGFSSIASFTPSWIPLSFYTPNSSHVSQGDIDKERERRVLAALKTAPETRDSRFSLLLVVRRWVGVVGDPGWCDWEGEAGGDPMRSVIGFIVGLQNKGR
jgi:hypothetical protein